jgi:DUF4097 and DUF4098 domain-containing protein YvlB
MKFWSGLLALSLPAAMLAGASPVNMAFGRTASAASESQDKGSFDESEDFRERDEFRQTYQLSPGSSVTVGRINGSVTVETADGDVAEVYVVRSARTREDLNFRKVVVEASSGRLSVEGEKWKDEDSDRKRRPVRQRVVLKLPRSVNLAVSGVNGSVRVTEIDGSATVGGVNGSVVVKRANSFSEISGINGSVTIGVVQVREKGMKISGVNGSVECQFGSQLNANLAVSGVNGSVRSELPNLTLQGTMSASNFMAQIGSGGPPIRISGVNGGVRLKNASE